MIIYELYRPIAIVAKYVGVAPLPGLYEGSGSRSFLIRVLLDHCLPLINLLIQSVYLCLIEYSLILLYTVSHVRGFDFLILTVAYINGSNIGLLISLGYYLKSGKLIVSYLRAHAGLDTLLAPKRSQLKRAITVSFFVAFLVIFAVCYVVLYVKRVEAVRQNFPNKEWYAPQSFNMVTPFLLVGAFLNAVAGSQLFVPYIAFHHILATAFQQLNDVIRAEKGRNSTAQQVKMIRHYSSLYNRLCELSARLDHLLAPLISYQLTVIMTNSVMLIAEVKGQQGFENKADVVKVILSIFTVLFGFFTQLYLITTFTSNTVKAAKKVLPTLFYSFDLSSKAVRSEVETFGLRVMCRRIVFTASGFFTIDREIIHTYVSTIISYSVVAIQIKYSN